MKQIVLMAALAVLGAGSAQAGGGKTDHSRTGKVIHAECSVEVFASVNSLDRPSERFVEEIRAAIGPRATRAEAYLLGETYCRHPQRLKQHGVAERALERDIVDMQRR